MATASVSTGLLNLERELSCSICTEVLYNPLTLLDCLHTFCGGCLKEWFRWQKLAAERKIQQDGRGPTAPYTCPSCRATVRDTKPNASVTTLLDMYLAANPDKGKTEVEKRELDVAYKRGDAVLPEAPQVPSHDDAAEEERRAARRARHEERRNRREHEGSRSRGSTIVQEDGHQANEPRRIELEHQSSIRSILSASDLNSVDMEEEIMQQIMEGGLLEGIDLHHLDQAQEDEITERIAQAYRRKQRERARETSQTRRRNIAERRPREGSAHPPLSRPHLLETASDGARQHRSASQDRRATSARSESARRRPAGDITSSPAVRSETDLSLRPRSDSRSRETPPRAHRSSTTSRSRERRATDPSSRSVSELWRSGFTEISTENPRSMLATSNVRSHGPALVEQESVTARRAAMPRIMSAPQIDCQSCRKQHIEFDLHYRCQKCSALKSTPYSLCQPCYRRGKGCLSWYGFGHVAQARLRKQSLSARDLGPAHALIGERYIRDPSGAISVMQGKFCDTCSSNANACYWSCDVCNEGDWGYCDSCVGQARHCSHPLLATAVDDSSVATPLKLDALPIQIPCNSCNQKISLEDNHMHCPTCQEGDYDLCMRCYTGMEPVNKDRAEEDPQTWRRCPNGHRMLIITYVLRVRESSPAHLLLNELHSERIVIEDVVGGWSLKAADVSSPSPMSARTAIEKQSKIRMLALWTRVPEDSAQDELSFPRNAKITDIQIINEDWAFGFYCRKSGLFPSNHGRRIG
jgi:Zn finger protein HypA/HybF involved in hydrogenase expression